MKVFVSHNLNESGNRIFINNKSHFWFYSSQSLHADFWMFCRVYVIEDVHGHFRNTANVMELYRPLCCVLLHVHFQLNFISPFGKFLVNVHRGFHGRTESIDFIKKLHQNGNIVVSGVRRSAQRSYGALI